MFDMRTIPNIVHDIENAAIQLLERSRRDGRDAGSGECTCPEFCELDHAN
jgi:hypothetical protein